MIYIQVHSIPFSISLIHVYVHLAQGMLTTLALGALSLPIHLPSLWGQIILSMAPQ